LSRDSAAAPEAPDLGQHFLVDADALARLVAAAGLRPGDVVLDVGAGEGAITRRLAEAVAPDGRVVAVEVDARLAAGLRARRWAGVRVVEADILAMDLPSDVDAVVANPPFRILSPLVLRLLEEGVGRIVLVVPREFAERALARPGTERYGRLTVQLAVRARAAKLFDLPRRAFQPPPEVPASVLRFEPRALPSGVDEAFLGALLEAAWASKQRTLRHGLASLAAGKGLSSGAITEALRDRGWEGARPGELAPRDFVELAKVLAPGAPGRGKR
jgi:16S rRNA (adenine1518-N6/adenine1519-N6)-dimethyltransferase